jgi:hypothetical protein
MSQSSSAVEVPSYSYTRFGRHTPRLKARMQPITYRRSTGDRVRISDMHDFHIVNAVAKIRRELVFGPKYGVTPAHYAALPDLQIEARKRGFTVE